MCRLSAYLGDPVSPALLLYGGSHSLYRQSFRPAELLSGSVNADGWGVAWFGEGGVVRMGAARPVWYERDVEALLSRQRAGAVVAAVRNATAGVPVDEASVPPLVLHGWAFVLNGFVPDFRRRFMRRLHARIPDELFGELRGVSDAEALFLLALARVREGEGAADALAALVSETRAIVEGEGLDTQLNMLLTDGATLAVTRASSTADVNSLYVGRDLGLAPGGVLVASERLDGDAGWEAVEPHTVLQVEGGSITTSRLPRAPKRGRGPAP